MGTKRKNDAKGGPGQEPEGGSAPETEADITGGAAQQDGGDQPAGSDSGNGHGAGAHDGVEAQGANWQPAEPVDSNGGGGSVSEVTNADADPAGDENPAPDAAVLDPDGNVPSDEAAPEPAAGTVAADGAAGSDQSAEPEAEEPAGEGPDGSDGGAAAEPGDAGADAVAGTNSPAEPEPDTIATTAMLAAGAAYYRAMRLGEDGADGIDLGWLIPDASAQDKRQAERAVMSLAFFCRKVTGGNVAAMAMHLKLSRFRDTGELTAEENVAYDTFAAVIAALDQLAERQAAIAREKHRKIPRPQPVDIEETTLELVDEPLAIDQMRRR